MKIRSLAIFISAGALLLFLALYGSRMYRHAVAQEYPFVAGARPSAVAGVPLSGSSSAESSESQLAKPSKGGNDSNISMARIPLSPSVLAWRRAMGGVSMETTALELLSSTDPNDWMRASALHILCISGVENMDMATFGKAFTSVVSRAAERCGALGTTAFLPNVVDTTPKAKQANNALALAPSLTNSSIEKGISASERDRLQALFADSELATLWLVRNSSRLHSTLANVDAFSGYSWQDLGAASVAAMCLRGIDCGETSILSMRLCLNAGREVCSDRGVLDALQGVGSERAQRINAAAQQIEIALSQGKPEMLGLRVKSP